MPVARPIMLTMLMANTETSKVCPTSAVSATANVMAMRLRKMGRPAATTAPNTISRMMSAMGTPMPSPLRRSRLGRVAEVALDAGRAGDQRVEPAVAVGCVHDLVHLVDVLLGLGQVAGHDQREDGACGRRPRPASCRRRGSSWRRRRRRSGPSAVMLALQARATAARKAGSVAGACAGAHDDDLVGLLRHVQLLRPGVPGRAWSRARRGSCTAPSGCPGARAR